MTKFVDLSFVTVVEVLSGAEDLNGFKTGVPHPFQPDSRQTVANEEVGRQYELHLDCSLEIDDDTGRQVD
jgi:hypothetical protein